MLVVSQFQLLSKNWETLSFEIILDIFNFFSLKPFLVQQNPTSWDFTCHQVNVMNCVYFEVLIFSAYAMLYELYSKPMTKRVVDCSCSSTKQSISYSLFGFIKKQN